MNKKVEHTDDLNRAFEKYCKCKSSCQFDCYFDPNWKCDDATYSVCKDAFKFGVEWERNRRGK